MFKSKNVKRLESKVELLEAKVQILTDALHHLVEGIVSDGQDTVSGREVENFFGGPEAHRIIHIPAKED